MNADKFGYLASRHRTTRYIRSGALLAGHDLMIVAGLGHQATEPHVRRASDAQCIAVHGRFLVIQPASKLVYTWNWVGMLADMPETQVMVEFHSRPFGTEIVLRQEHFLIPLCTQHLTHI